MATHQAVKPSSHSSCQPALTSSHKVSHYLSLSLPPLSYSYSLSLFLPSFLSLSLSISLSVSLPCMCLCLPLISLSIAHSLFFFFLHNFISASLSHCVSQNPFSCPFSFLLTLSFKVSNFQLYAVR